MHHYHHLIFLICVLLFSYELKFIQLIYSFLKLYVILNRHFIHNLIPFLHALCHVKYIFSLINRLFSSFSISIHAL